MKYKNGITMKIGDIFTDGTTGREDVRLKNRAKVLYVDKYVLVWFPLNDFTIHANFEKEKYISKTWYLSSEPNKVELNELTEDELIMYNKSDSFLIEEENKIN